MYARGFEDAIERPLRPLHREHLPFGDYREEPQQAAATQQEKIPGGGVSRGLQLTVLVIIDTRLFGIHPREAVTPEGERVKPTCSARRRHYA